MSTEDTAHQLRYSVAVVVGIAHPLMTRVALGEARTIGPRKQPTATDDATSRSQIAQAKVRLARTIGVALEHQDHRRGIGIGAHTSPRSAYYWKGMAPYQYRLRSRPSRLSEAGLVIEVEIAQQIR